MKNTSFKKDPDKLIKLKPDKLVLRDGDRVSHNEFGEGVVISVMDDLLVIAFKKIGIKRISAEYANLKKL